MAEFILIGSNEKMQKIVTGISEYQPQSICHHNISTGIILHDNGEPVKYQSIDKSSCKEDNQSLDNYLLNQLAHHRTYSKEQGAAVNIFLLCSLYDSQDLKDIDFLYDGMRSLIGNDTNVNVTWILFSFDITNSSNVKKRAEKEEIRRVLNLCRHLPINDSDINKSSLSLFPSKVLYFNNRDMDNAAVCFEHNETYDFIVDFLSGFFYLASNNDDAYNIINSYQSGDIFSIGYADFAYRPQDVSKYMTLRLLRDQLSDMFSSNVDTNFDYNFDDVDNAIERIKSIASIFPDPQGLNAKKSALYSLFEEPTLQDINEYRALSPENCQAWIFKAQNYYMNQIESYVEKYNDYCAHEFKEAIETYERICNQFAETGEVCPDKEDFLRGQNIPEEIKYTTWQDVVNTSPYGKMTKVEKAHLQEVYDGYLQTKQELLTDNLYERLTSIPDKEVYSNKVNPIQQEQVIQQKNKGCIHRLISLFKRSEQPVLQTVAVQDEDTFETEPLDLLRQAWAIYNELECSKSIFHDFINAYVEIENEINKVETEIDKFSIYQLTKSVSVIDAEKLEPYFISMLQEMRMYLESLRENTIIFFDIPDVKEKVKQTVLALEHKWNKLDWDNPFSFISDMTDIANRINYLQKHNSVFADIEQVSSTNSLCQTDLKVYSNSQRQIKLIDDLKNNHYIKNAAYITCIKSEHILNRLCMYKIIKIDIENIKDLK